MEKQKIRRIAVDVDEDLFFKFKSKVFANQKKMKEVLTDLVKKYAENKIVIKE